MCYQLGEYLLHYMIVCLWHSSGGIGLTSFSGTMTNRFTLNVNGNQEKKMFFWRFFLAPQLGSQNDPFKSHFVVILADQQETDRRCFSEDILHSFAIRTPGWLRISPWNCRINNFFQIKNLPVSALEVKVAKAWLIYYCNDTRDSRRQLPPDQVIKTSWIFVHARLLIYQTLRWISEASLFWNHVRGGRQ